MGENIPFRLDGPYLAPSSNILRDSKGSVLVCVGYGVGITPFLSLLSYLSNKGVDWNHFFVKIKLYWITRNASDFLYLSPFLEQIRNHKDAHMLSIQIFCTSAKKES